MLFADLLAQYRDGDEHGWDVEFAWLRAHHAGRLAALRAEVRESGIREPVLLGNDGRVWDGHHRLCIAVDDGIVEVPVAFDAPTPIV